MEIQVKHLGVLYTLDVYSDEDGDFFSVTKLEGIDYPVEFEELATAMENDAFDLKNMAREELARVRRLNQRDFEEARAA